MCASKLEYFDESANGTDDFGFICQTEPFEFFYNKNPVDTTKIPDNIAITYGDNLYDYSVINTETGDTTTMNEYITNNYVINGGGTTSGNVSGGGDVTVGGKVDIGGKVEFSPVEIKPIDINVNVNGGSDGTSSGGDVGDYISESGAAENIDPYLEKIPEISKGFTDYLRDFFTWLPKEIYGLLILGLVVAIWCRIAGR